MASRFLRKSTRRQIRDFDNFQNVYPNLRRSSDQTNLTFDNQSPFDDTRTLKYSSASVTFPAMVPPGYNTHPSSSISLSNLTKIRVSAQEYLPDLPGSKVSPPFDETRLNIPGTEDYIATSSDYRIGFKSATRNKIAIPIDISTNESKTLFKLSKYDTARDPEGPLYGKESTGFVYYNFQEKRWEDIGLTDQYRGHMGSTTTWAPSNIFIQDSGISGSDYYMQQFIPSTNQLYKYPGSYLQSENLYLNFGLSKIGSPTWFFDAPNADRYHATSSQLFSLSSFIDQPFILEEIEVSMLPISATRINGPLTGSGSTSGGRLPYAAADSGRDIDCINFFIYRQNSTKPKNDNPKESTRKLLTYATFAFYNKDLGLYTDQLSDNLIKEIVKPQQSFDYGLDNTVPNTTSTVERRVSFKIKPKNTVSQIQNLLQQQSVYTLSQSLPGVEKSLPTLMYNVSWLGSDGYPYLSDENPMFFTSRSGSPTQAFDRAIARNLKFQPAFYVNSRILNTTKDLRPDTRFIYKTAVYPLNDFFSVYDFFEPGDSPYILFPDDKLIFGIESLVPVVTPGQAPVFDNAVADSSYLSVTSSLHKIISGSVKITLYGSLIQNNQEKLFNHLNQNLTSPAIHELVYDPTEDSDQFLIGERKAYSGSYLDHFFSTGSVLNSARFVSASLTSQADLVGGRGSFERFVNLRNPNEIYYDCLMTDTETFVELDNEESSQSFSYNSSTDSLSDVNVGGSTPYTTMEISGNRRPIYPYKKGGKRRLDVPKYFNKSYPTKIYSGKEAKQMFFYTGYNPNSLLLHGVDNKPYYIRPFFIFSPSFESAGVSANSVAYGMLNILDQQPRYIFRPDRYGQYRDMLEQPLDSIVYSLTGKRGPTISPVTIQFVSASSEIVVDPARTNSNNLNAYATSSLPYFDGENRSRASAFPTSSLDPFTPTTIVFQT